MQNLPYLPVANIEVRKESFQQESNYIYSISSEQLRPSQQSNCFLLTKIFSKSNIKSLVFWITLLDIALYILCNVIEISTKTKYSCVLYNFGASYAPSVAALHQWHRLIAPVFLHWDIWHLVFNMLAQMTFCRSLEESLGLNKFILIYFGTALSGVLLSQNASQNVLAVGASTAIYGTLGFELTYVLENYEELGSRRRNYIVLLFMYVFSGISHGGKNIDFYGHMGILHTLEVC